MWLTEGLRRYKDMDMPAIVERTRTRTFKEIWDNSEKLAWFFIEMKKKAPVVIYGDKDPDMVTTMIAAVKAGITYVPVDVSYPLSRLDYISRSVDCCAIFNFTDIDIVSPYPVLSGADINAIFKNNCTREVPSEYELKEEQICYILFTSGSTGTPKGVPITRKNLMVYINWYFYHFRTAEIGQNILNSCPYSFDGSVAAIYCYLAEGKTMICTDKGLNKDNAAMLEWLYINHVSVFYVTPAFIDIYRQRPEFNGDVFESVEQFILGGEVLTKPTAEYLLDHFPRAEVHNGCGPTEATIAVTGCRITREMINDPAHNLPIGYIIDGIDYFIDDNGRLCKDGEPGELCVIGDNVSAGYYMDSERTAKVFFDTEDGRRGYRTGDLVYQYDGLIYYMGRIDNQIKVNGYRIELEDVTNHFVRVSRIAQGAVIPHYDRDHKVDFLVGCAVLKEEYKSFPKINNMIEIKKELAAHVPVYMVPRKMMFFDVLPLNINGKVDLKELSRLMNKDI